MTPSQFRERFVSALQDALRADIDPAAGGHLAVHGQATVFEIAEDVPRGPRRYEHGGGNYDARRRGMRAEHGDRLAGLDDECLIVCESLQGVDDRVERVPRARGATGTAVDDQIVRAFRHGGIEIVHQHPQRGFLRPSLAGDGGAARRADVTAENVYSPKRAMSQSSRAEG